MRPRDGDWFGYDVNGRRRRSRRYLPLWQRRLRFRFGTLNAVGWAAVFGPGIVLGLAVGLLIAIPLVVAVPLGAATTWSAVFVADRIHHPADRRL